MVIRYEKKQELEMAPRYWACITNGVDRCWLMRWEKWRRDIWRGRKIKSPVDYVKFKIPFRFLSGNVK